MTAIRLRPYQNDAVNAVENAWNHDVRRPAIVMGTGGGKTSIFSTLIHRYRSANSDRRVLVLADRDELIDQATSRIRDVAPDLRIGKVAAKDNDVNADVLVASVQTLRRQNRRDQVTDVGLIVVDECDLAVAPSYLSIFSDFPDALMLGVTATMHRADGTALSKVWDEIVYEYGLLDLIRAGWLVDLRGVRIEVADLDLSGVRTTAGDYNEGDLGEAMEMSMAPEVVAAAYVEHASDRSGLLFAPTIAVAELMSFHLNGAGIISEVVTGKTPKDERKAMLRRYTDGHTQVLANVGVLTRGTDLPRTSCIVLARMTKSKALYTQILGRGSRLDPLDPSKVDCLVLDVAGATSDNSLCSLSTLAGREVKPGRSLMEAEQDEFAELEEMAARPSAPAHAGRVSAREVDLFAAARRRWRKTAGGLPYLSTPIAYLFVYPGADGDTYDIGWLATKNGLVNGKPGGNVREGLSSLSAAMTWAEQAADEADPDGVFGEKDRPWHRRKASEKSIGYARMLGIAVGDGARAVEVSDLIDGVLATRTIDSRILPFLAESGRLPAADATDASSAAVAL